MDSRPRLGENGFIFKYVWENLHHFFGNLQYIVTYSSKKKYKNFLYLRILQTYLSMTLLVDLGKMWVYRNVLGYPLFHHYV